MNYKKLRWLPLLLVVAFLCSCGSQSTEHPPLFTEFPGPETPSLSFSPTESESLTLSQEGASAILEAVAQTQPDYIYADMYELEEVKSRLDFEVSVQSHQYCALDETGTLTPEHLRHLVTENNEAFLASEPFGYTSVEKDYITELCSFIVQVVNIMSEKYPDLDWNRVYCNLGNLKILYKTGLLAYAQVNDDLILSLNASTAHMATVLNGEDAFTQILAHEIIHIIQIGCVCENIENASRRAGISMYWDDFPLNTADWTWMVEGSAERHSCVITGIGAIAYQYKMDYLCSLTLSLLLRDSVKADTIECLSFYDDTELLFETFGCKTEEERDELLKMMITMQILQMQPENFHYLIKEQTGVDLKNDEEAMDQFSLSLKPAVCTTLAKEFYENLATFLQDNQISCNDLFFLLNLFEGHMFRHLSYTKEALEEINRPFMDNYRALREALFTALEADNPGMDLFALYEDYSITSGNDLLNADLSMLSEEKRTFLRERAQWLSELLSLGQKVPQ